jgi:hypothetical protein
MIRKHFRLRRRLVAGLVFALVAVPAASATTYVSGERSTPTVAKAIEVVGDHGKTYPQLSQAQIEAMRWQAKADAYYSRPTPISTEHSFGASKQQPVEPTVVSVASPDGFDWADAGIGASVAFAGLLVLASLLVVGRRSRKDLDNAGLTTA